MQPQKTRYSTGTKLFFWLFISCVFVLVSGFMFYYYWWFEDIGVIFGVIFLVSGGNGALITGIILLILWIRDLLRKSEKKKGKKRGVV